jgi:hypothetical protein
MLHTLVLPKGRCCPPAVPMFLEISPRNAVATPYAGFPQNASATVSLDSLRTPDLILRVSIPVRLTWDPGNRAYVAYEEAFHLWYGTGLSRQEALEDLQDVLVETYHHLERHESHLAPPLRRDFASLRQVIAHASQGK